MKNRHIYILGLLATLLCSCSATDDPDTADQKDMEVNFSMTMQTNDATRGGQAGVISDLDYLKYNLNESFGIFAYLTERKLWNKAKRDDYDALLATNAAAYPTPDFMYNQPVHWDVKWVNGEGTHEGWMYEPLKYWPNYSYNDISQARYVSFYAYAPFTDDLTGTGIVGFPDAGDKSPHVVYRQSTNVSNMVDLLWAAKPDGTRNGQGLIYFAGEEKRYQTVPLQFRHALAAIDIYVVRAYDSQTPNDDDPPEADDTKIFVNKLQLSTTDAITQGKLNLEDGTWTDTGTGTTQTFTYTGNDIALWVRGSDKDGTDPSGLSSIRTSELDKWDWRWTDSGSHDDENGTLLSGIIEDERRLNTSNNTLLLIPTSTAITFTPTVSYSFVTRDDALEFGYYQDTQGALGNNNRRFSRLFHTIEGNSITLQLQPAKYYKLVCRIGVEHVSFEVTDVEDWDFPMRFTTTVSDTEKEVIPITVKE